MTPNTLELRHVRTIGGDVHAVHGTGANVFDFRRSRRAALHGYHWDGRWGVQAFWRKTSFSNVSPKSSVLLLRMKIPVSLPDHDQRKTKYVIEPPSIRQTTCVVDLVASGK